MCLARSFFSSTIEAQFDTGATHGDADLDRLGLRGAERVRSRPSAASANFSERMKSSRG